MFLSTFFAVGILAIDVRGEGPPILENSNNEFTKFIELGSSWVDSYSGVIFLDASQNGCPESFNDFQFGNTSDRFVTALEALVNFADNAESIDFTQPEFYHFKIWQDRNGDGKCTSNETSRLANLNAQIDLTSKEFVDQQIYSAVVLDRVKLRMTKGGEQHELDLYNIVLDLPSI